MRHALLIVVLVALQGCGTNAASPAAGGPSESRVIAPPVAEPLEVPFATIRPSADESERCRVQPSSSKCRFMAVDAEWHAYAAVRAPAAERDLKLVGRAIDAKKVLRDRIAKQYFELIDERDDEWSVAASCRAAEALLEYGNFLLVIDPPPKVPDTNPFIDRAWTMSFVIFEQAVQQLDRTAERARERGVDSAYSRRCAVQRARVRGWLDDPYRAPLPLRSH